MSLSYCRQWFRARKYPAEILSECEARRDHAAGVLYTAVLNSDSRPTAFLEFSAFRSVAVEFLDVHLRTYLDYSFQELEKGSNKLFLSLACIRQFDGDGDDPIRGPVCYYKPDGRLLIEHFEYDPQTRIEQIVAREEAQVDVSQNWEPYPEFGQYEGLSRIRNLPGLTL
jgi:hypothetical protein